ncbi:MAG: hypothetical protein AAFS12_00140 [Cyanobacteria bacterium J06632_19]
MFVLHLLERTDNGKILILNVSKTLSHWAEGYKDLSIIYCHDDNFEVPSIVEGHLNLSGDLMVDKQVTKLSQIDAIAIEKAAITGLDVETCLHFLSDYALISVQIYLENQNAN